jgi:hypothetical protein
VNDDDPGPAGRVSSPSREAARDGDGRDPTTGQRPARGAGRGGRAVDLM